MLENWIYDRQDTVLLEYVFQDWFEPNANLMGEYNLAYGTGGSVPLMVKNAKEQQSGVPGFAGTQQIYDYIDGFYASDEKCLLLEGEKTFEETNLNELPQTPKLWAGNRLLERTGPEDVDNAFLKELLLSDNLEEALANSAYELQEVEAETAPYSGGEVAFEQAVQVGGWTLKLREKIDLPENVKPVSGSNDGNGSNGGNGNGGQTTTELTIPAIISLALVDSINPCAIAVLGLLIIAYMTRNPNERKKALLAGAMFILAVYIIYLVYGLLIVYFLSSIMGMFSGTELLIYGLFSLLAIALGIYNVKDFFHYRPGGLLREMPMKWRPKMKKILAGIESPKGGFVLGIFVTLFLLPCTIGPLLMAGTLLAKFGAVSAVPWLLLYNAIFVLPMAAIVAAIYVGLTMVENVTEWKDRNIKYLHLAAGTVMAAIGIYLAWEAENAFHFSLGPLDLNFFTIGIIEIPVLAALILLKHRKTRE